MYGILKSNSNTGEDPTELACQFAAPIAIKSKRVVFSSDSLSLKRLSSSGPAQRWEIETNIAQSNFGVPFAINNLVNDVNKAIYVRMPQPIQKFGNAVGAGRGASINSVDSVVSNGADTIGLDETGVYSLLISEFGDSTEIYPTASPIRVSNSQFANANGQASASSRVAGNNSISMTLEVNSQVFEGSFIQFDGHKKVYMIAEITNISNNTVTATIFPNLKSDVSNGETISLGNNVTMEATYDDGSVVGMKYSDGIVSDPGVVKLVESL